MVEITDADIRRLVEHTGIRADNLVKLYSKAEIESEEESDWIKLSYGKRTMGLRKRRNGDCIFLSPDKTCMAYEARPMTCRIFPVCVVYDDDFTIVDMEISEVIRDRTIRCRRSLGNGRSHSSFMPTAKQSQKEYVIFRRKIEEWNGSHGKGLKKDFLSFLEFRSSNNSSG
jgi:Fe-S-cluster containining protein